MHGWKPRLSRPVAVSIVLALAAIASPALAVPPVDQAAAEVLFRDGQRLANAKDFAAACPKFAESQRLDPAAGTLLNLASCLEAEGKLASAWGTFGECAFYAKSVGDHTREKEATRRAGLLEPQLSRVSIVVSEAVRATKGITVERDGKPVPDGAWGSALPLDAGEHTFRVSAPGRLTWTTKVTLTGPGVTTVDVPPLPIDLVKPTPSAAAPGSSPQRVAGIVVVSAGAAGLTAGVVAGGIAAAEHSNLIGLCPTTHCPAVLQSNVDSYHRAAAVSTATFIVGGVLAAGGVVVLVTAPKAQGPTVAPVVGFGFVGAQGRFW
jgi:hypothetical protein